MSLNGLPFGSNQSLTLGKSIPTIPPDDDKCDGDGGNGGGDGCGGGTDGGGPCSMGSAGIIPLPKFPAYAMPGPDCKCLDPNTLITLQDGSRKSASQLIKGDQLFGPDCQVETITSVFEAVEPKLRIVHSAGTLVCSESHLIFLTNRSFVRASLLEHRKDQLLAEDGSPIEILQIEPIGTGPVIALTCEPTHVYQAAGLVHHNKPPTPVGGWPSGDL